MVSPKTRAIVWARGAGRCHYCNQLLIGDYVAGNEHANFGFVAHIVGEQENSPRGDSVRSPQLADDPSNLMLMCYPHHKLVDVDERDNYPEERLLEMKRLHEERIEILTEIAPERATHVLRYGAKIGTKESLITYSMVREAVLPLRYPAGGRSIGIEILGNAATDGEEDFWRTEPNNLCRQFNILVAPQLASREITHLSVFGIGPIPLLIQLGSLIGDIIPVDVFQKHREPAGWVWAEDGEPIVFDIGRPETGGNDVALKLSVSGTVTDERIQAVMGAEVPIWSVAARRPGNDVMRHRDDLRAFRTLMRGLYDDMKAQHGEAARIHVFPAVPVSMAVELGRVRMPKADLPLTIYDSRLDTGFVPRLDIS